MAADPLEEKINKIRLQNEEIRRRHEEVEADKQNAAKLNALVQMVPSTDWPERKEPLEFSSPPINKVIQKPRSTRENNCPSLQYRAGSDGKKLHIFGQNEGPPPDPKYNFLADAEREENYDDHSREEQNKTRGKSSRRNFKKRGTGRDWQMKETKGKSGTSPQDLLPDYEAWRAERNKIDEARISRQRTAEGNWKREWDNDKMHLVDETKRENHSTLGDAMRHPRMMDKRIIASSENNIQVPLNHSTSTSKNPLMSVKVSSPNIAGTGRVGPRQRTRVMYSSQSETEIMNFEVGNFVQPKSPDEKPKNFGISSKTDSKSLHSQRRKDLEKSHSFRREQEKNTGKYHRKSESDAKSPGVNRKDFRNFQKSPHVQRRANALVNYPAKSPRINRKFSDGFHETIEKRGNNEVMAIRTAINSKDNHIETPEKLLKSDEIRESKMIEKKSEGNEIDPAKIPSGELHDSPYNLIKEKNDIDAEKIDEKSIDLIDESMRVESLKGTITATLDDSVIDKPETVRNSENVRSSF